jgi:nucleotide-binding universal stress UspA family protein
MFKKIVVALDGSRYAEEALEVALKLAHAEGGELGNLLGA